MVNAVSDSELEFKELIIGTVVHEAIHSMEEYNFNVDEGINVSQYNQVYILITSFVPFDQHPYGALAQYFKTDDGVVLMKSLTKKLT